MDRTHYYIEHSARISTFIICPLSWSHLVSTFIALSSLILDIGWSISRYKSSSPLQLLSALETGHLICTLANDFRGQPGMGCCLHSWTVMGWHCSLVLSACILFWNVSSQRLTAGSGISSAGHVTFICAFLLRRTSLHSLTNFSRPALLFSVTGVC